MAGELDDSAFKALHAELQPKADAPWRTIPWKISLLDAQAAAAAEQKPIFIWAHGRAPAGMHVKQRRARP